MLCRGEERGGGGGCAPPARPATPRGSPPRAAGDRKPEETFFAQTLVCQTGEGGEQLAGCWAERAQGKAGVSYSRQCRGPTIRPPVKHIPTSPTNHSCSPPDDGKMGLSKSTVQLSLSPAFRRWGRSPGLNTLCCDLLISGEIKPTRHEQSPKGSLADPHPAAFVCGGTGRSGQHPPGKFPFHTIEQWAS